MKVFALGGYGKVGFPAIKVLAQSELITEIAVAGRKLDAAEAAARDIGEKAVAVYADGSDEEKLASQVAGYDIIINAAYDDVVVPCIKAAIGSGTHYCDANGVNEEALQLTDDAEAAGITAIISNGIGPAISNLMGVHAARQLEEVGQLQLGFPNIFNWENGHELTPQQWLNDPGENLAALHGCRPFIAMILRILQDNGIQTAIKYRDGRWVEIDPVVNGIDVPLEDGSTDILYPYASSEPLWRSMPLDLATESAVEIFFSPLPPQLHDLLRERALQVLAKEVNIAEVIDSFYETVESDPRHWFTLPDDFVTPTNLWVTALGQKHGRAARHSCWFKSELWGVGGYFLTGAALAAAASKILRGEIQERGVMTAEKTFEPLSFFDEVASTLPVPLPEGKLIGESFAWLE